MLNNQRVYYIYTVSENKITKLRFTSVISLVFHLTPLKSPLTVDGTTIHCWSWINIILQKKPRKSIKISNIIHQYPTYLPNKFTASRLTRPTAILPILPGFMYLSQYLAARSGSGPKHLSAWALPIPSECPCTYSMAQGHTWLNFRMIYLDKHGTLIKNQQTLQ